MSLVNSGLSLTPLALTVKLVGNSENNVCSKENDFPRWPDCSGEDTDNSSVGDVCCSKDTTCSSTSDNPS